MNKQIEEILKEYHRNYKEYTLEAAMENNPTPNDILIEDIIALIQKEREDAWDFFCLPSGELQNAFKFLIVDFLISGCSQCCLEASLIIFLVLSV